MEQSNRRQSAAEVRLLVATITISAVALLLLARLRFPAPPPVPQIPVAPPLERLAAATYEELARIVGTAQARLAPSLIPLRLTRRPAAEVPLDSRDLVPPPQDPGMSLAIRYSETRALSYIPPGTALPDRSPGGDPIKLVALDEIRGLALLDVPAGPAIVPRSSTGATVDVPAYLAIGEPSAAGASLRPVFVSRADATSDPRWRTTVLALGIEPAAAGRPLFSLGGEFIGLLLPGDGGVTLLSAADVMAAVTRLQAGGSVERGTFGFSVQPLTRPLAAATGTSAGVVVTLVDPDGPAAASLRVGDVIEAVNGQRAADLDTFLARVSAAQAGLRLVLTIVRAGTRSETTVVTSPERPAPPGESTLGLTLRTLGGVGTEIVVVTPGGAGSRAGLRAGDLVTHLNGEERPTAAAIQRAWTSAEAPLVLGIRRGVQPVVVALAR
jgi:S1-C subfamily serine protease